MRGRVVSWAAAGAPVKLWRLRVQQEVAASVSRAGGRAAVAAMVDRTDALGLAVVFTFPTEDASKWGRAHTAKPDADNLVKLLMDVLTAEGATGGLDDAHISALEPAKVWGATGGAGWTLRMLAGRKMGVGLDDEAAGMVQPPWWALPEAEDEEE